MILVCQFYNLPDYEKNTSLLFCNFPVLKNFILFSKNHRFRKNRKKIILSNKKADYKTARVAVNTFRTIKAEKYLIYLKIIWVSLKSLALMSELCLVAEGKIDDN